MQNEKRQGIPWAPSAKVNFEDYRTLNYKITHLLWGNLSENKTDKASPTALGILWRLSLKYWINRYGQQMKIGMCLSDNIKGATLRKQTKAFHVEKTLGLTWWSLLAVLYYLTELNIVTRKKCGKPTSWIRLIRRCQVFSSYY